ncbi:MAG: protein kinase [Polyangiaceae bacterium]
MGTGWKGRYPESILVLLVGARAVHGGFLHPVVQNVADKSQTDAANPAARVGQVIKGKWTIEALLGVGGMAAVYSAVHRNSTRAALKILHADFAREKTVVERFLREAYVSNKVGHPATVQVQDDDVTENGEPYLVMELLEGETVRDAWKKCGRTMPVVRVLQIAERVLDCLVACHAINVIHRDLKPANIFITDIGDIKVLDFGVAQMRDATSERTATGTALGTPAYMSPEQAMGLVDQLDGRADLFSVGAMIHALVTGHRINNGRTEQEALVMAATKPVPSVARLAPNLPLEVIALTDKSLQWDRRNRFADAGEMQSAVLEALAKQGGEPLTYGGAAARRGKGPAGPAQPQPAPQAPQPVPANEPSHGGTSGSSPQANAPLASGSHVAARGDGSGAKPAPAKPAPAPPAPAAVEVAENDPRVQGVKDLFRHFDRVLPSVRQFGWQHPATDRALRTAHDAFRDSLMREPELMKFTVRPYSFVVFGHNVWEPQAPYDSIPYNLFACGIREMRIGATITLEELRECLTLMSLDPGRDLPPEDDIAAAFWEKNIPSVSYECAEAFAEGDAGEREAFFEEADQLEQQAENATRQNISRIETRTMAISTDKNALVAPRTQSVLALDEVVKGAMLSQFEMSRDQWADRFVDCLVDGFLDAAANRDAPLVLASLRKSGQDLVVAGRVDVLVQLYNTVVERVGHRVSNAENQRKLAMVLTSAMFGGETFDLVIRKLRDDPSRVDVFLPIIALLPPSEIPVVQAALREPSPPQVRSLLVGYLERHLAGREGEIAQVALGADSEVAAAIVGLLGRAGTPAARQALGSLAQTDDVNVRVEARILMMGSPDQAVGEVSRMLDNPSALVRMAALRAMIRYGLRGAWVAVQRVVQSKPFFDLGSDERKELLRALFILGADRGEPMLIELVKKGGVLASESRESTRAIACEVLGDFSRSRLAIAALNEVFASRWGTAEETRQAATAALAKIAARVEGGSPS